MRISCPRLKEPFVTIFLRDLNVVSAAPLAEEPWDGVMRVQRQAAVRTAKGQLNASSVDADRSSETLPYHKKKKKKK